MRHPRAFDRIQAVGTTWKRAVSSCWSSTYGTFRRFDLPDKRWFNPYAQRSAAKNFGDGGPASSPILPRDIDHTRYMFPSPVAGAAVLRPGEQPCRNNWPQHRLLRRNR